MIFISIFYLLAQLILVSGLVKLLRKIPLISGDVEISVVTAAKNESHNIERFIGSIKNINYPAGKFETIIIDDSSTDGTYEIALKAADTMNNLSVIRAEEKLLPSKRGVLLKGIEKSGNSNILVTDADCIVSPQWLTVCASIFQQGYDFIFGPAPLIRKQNNFISSVACMENLKNHFLSFSLASLGLPYTAAARNLGFSKKAFFKIGGYSNTLETLSGDDDLLLREAVKNKLKIKVFYDKNAFVYSYTADNLKDYLRQKSRHVQSSFHYSLKNKIIISGWHLLNLFMLFSPILMFLDINIAWLAVVKITTDIMILYFMQERFSYKFNPIQLLYLNITYEIFLIINFFNSLFVKPEWK